jgi:hypothetical protein
MVLSCVIQQHRRCKQYSAGALALPYSISICEVNNTTTLKDMVFWLIDPNTPIVKNAFTSISRCQNSENKILGVYPDILRKILWGKDILSRRKLLFFTQVTRNIILSRNFVCRYRMCRCQSRIFFSDFLTF